VLIATHKLPPPFIRNSIVIHTHSSRLLRPWKWKQQPPTKCRCLFTNQHGVISQKNVSIKQIWNLTYLTEFANISAHNHVIVPHSPVLIIPFKRFLQSRPCSYLLVHLHICFGQVVPSFKSLKSFHRRACSCAQFYFILNACWCPISYNTYCCN